MLLVSHQDSFREESNKKASPGGNFEEELPKSTVGKLSADSGPSANRQINLTVQTANRQATDRSIKIIKVHERKQKHSSVLLDQNKL